eukprot:gene8312-biopygen2660
MQGPSGDGLQRVQCKPPFIGSRKHPVRLTQDSWGDGEECIEICTQCNQGTVFASVSMLPAETRTAQGAREDLERRCSIARSEASNMCSDRTQLISLWVGGELGSIEICPPPIQVSTCNHLKTDTMPTLVRTIGDGGDPVATISEEDRSSRIEAANPALCAGTDVECTGTLSVLTASIPVGNTPGHLRLSERAQMGAVYSALSRFHLKLGHSSGYDR